MACHSHAQGVWGEGSPHGCNPDRAIASVNRCPFLSHIRLLTHLFLKGSGTDGTFMAIAPKL